jgi:hypothetical protein
VNKAAQTRDPNRFQSKVVRAETKVLDGSLGRVEAIMSTEQEDREGDVIRAAGWVLDSFLQHPILLSSHDYYSLRNQIGEWEDVKIRSKQLVGTARYYVGEGNEEADWGYKLAARGRAAYSVGFIPLEFKEREAATYTTGWGAFEFVRQELLETSHVTVPANPGALQLMVRSKTLHPALRAIAHELLTEQGETVAKQELGMCVMPDCEAQASVAMPMCKECIQKAMQPGPMPMMGEAFTNAIEGSVWLLQNGVLVPVEKAGPQTAEPPATTDIETANTEATTASGLTLPPLDWADITRLALSGAAREGVN